MDWSNILIGVLALVGTLGGSYMANNKVIVVMQEKLKFLDKKFEERINNLAARVDKHNQVIDRTYKLESDVRTAFIRLDELRDDIIEIKAGEN